MTSTKHGLMYVGMSLLYGAQCLGANHLLVTALVGSCYAVIGVVHCRSHDAAASAPAPEMVRTEE